MSLAESTEEQEQEFKTQQKVNRIAIGSGVVIFLIGSVFWAGATYDKIGELEKHLTNIENKFSVLDGIPVLQRDMVDHERRLEKLEDYLRKNP